MLYNEYRGLIRIYYYTTTQFVTPSTYIVDGLTAVTGNGKPTNMLDFVGSDVVTYNGNKASYSQIEPAPADGSAPLASNKWYMLQYEIAYDPKVKQYNTNDLLLSWFMNYNSVSTISLGGTSTGTIKTATGGATADVSSALHNGAGGAVQGVAAIIGASALANNKTDTTGKNKMGLPDQIFKAIINNTASALSTVVGGIGGKLITGLFGAVLGGSSAAPTVNEVISTNITLTGTTTTSGSFPSSPTSLYVPGTIISPAVPNYIPLDTLTMGVFYLNAAPTVNCKYDNQESATTTYTLPLNESAGTNLIFSPRVLAIATIQNIKEQVVLIDPQIRYPWSFNPQTQSYYGFYASSGTKETIGTHTAYTGTTFSAFSQGYDWNDPDGGYTVFNGMEIQTGLGIRVQFDVVPKNGAPKSVIIKTFNASPVQL